MHSHLLLNFASTSKANKFPDSLAPSVPLGVVCVSNPTWPAFSVHKDSTEQQGHKDGQEEPELPKRKTTHIAAFAVLLRNNAPKNVPQRDDAGDSGSLQAPVTLTLDCTR